MSTNTLGKGCIPIAALSPYVSNNWKLKVRVTEKDDKIRSWDNDRSKGTLFSFTLMDNEGYEIRATAFNKEAEKFFNLIHVNKIYYFSKGRIKATNFGASRGKKSEYQLSCTKDTVIEVCKDEDSFAQRSFNFVAINKITAVSENEFIDVIGCVKEITDARQFTSRNNREVSTRRIMLVDQNAAIEVTLWNQQATKITAENTPIGSVLILPGCRVSGFGGRSLSAAKVLTESIP
eukprot:UN00804